MKSYPEKLLILFPVYKLVEYRYELTAIDDVFVVHRHAPEDFLFELRPPLNLTTRGANSYSSVLRDLAEVLEDGYHLLIVDRDRFLENLEAMALRHAPAKSRTAVDQAIQLITDRTPVQIHDHRFVGRGYYEVRRMSAGHYPRKTGRCQNLDSPDCMFHVWTPRGERMWHLLVEELLDPTTAAAAMAAWKGWCARNRPDFPQVDDEPADRDSDDSDADGDDDE